MLPSAQGSLSRIPAKSLHLRSPHLRFPASQSWIGTAQPRAGTLVFPTSHQSRIRGHRSCVGDSLATRHFPRNFFRMRSYKKRWGEGQHARKTISLGRVLAFGGAADQLAENGGNLVELRGLIEEVVGAGRHALVAVLLIRVIRADQH